MKVTKELFNYADIVFINLSSGNYMIIKSPDDKDLYELVSDFVSFAKAYTDKYLILSGTNVEYCSFNINSVRGNNSMNYIKDVCTKIFELDWDDTTNTSSKFTLIGENEESYKNCFFTDEGLIKDSNEDYLLSVESVLYGKYKIKNNPKIIPFYDCPLDEDYWYIYFDDSDNLVSARQNRNTIFDYYNRNNKNMFATDDLSQEQINNVIARIKREDD